MITSEEIQHRIERADAAKSAKRLSAAREVGELAKLRSAAAEQLADLERQLGTALIEAADVIDVDELAEFTDVPAADLARWLAARKPARAKRGRRPGKPPKSETAAPGPHPAPMERD